MSPQVVTLNRNIRFELFLLTQHMDERIWVDRDLHVYVGIQFYLHPGFLMCSSKIIREHKVLFRIVVLCPL
jgi:hypothetical protein